MIPASLLPLTASWLVAADDVDTYGDIVHDWTAATSTTITCRIEQTGTGETDDETRDTTTATFRLFTNTTGIGGRDRVTVGDVTYDVIGTPALVYGATGVDHLEATLRAVDVGESAS